MTTTNEVLLKLEKEIRIAEFKRDLALTKNAEEWFRSGMKDSDTLSATTDRITFYTKDKDANKYWPKEVLQINHYCLFRERTVKKLETSFYSTNENSIFELNRMVLIGEIAQILINDSEAIIDSINEIVGKHKKFISGLYAAKWEIEKEERDLALADAEREKDERMKGFYSEEGIKFQKLLDKYDRYQYPTIQGRTEKRCIDGVTGVKFIRISKSGLTVTVKLTREWLGYKDGETTYNEIVEEKRFKLTQIEELVNNYKKYIV